MAYTSEAAPSTATKEVLTSESEALGAMLSTDRASGELSPEDNAAYKELIAENRDQFVALNKEGQATSVESVGQIPAPTSERSRESALSGNENELEKAREAVMRQFGNVEDNWRNTGR